MPRARYGLVVLLSTAALISAAVVAYARLADRPPRSLSELVGEASDTFAVHDAADIRPHADAYRRFAVEDSIWRARNDRMLLRWQTSLGAVWHISPRQLVQDSAFYLVRDQRLADAADLLGRWLVAHPQDDELRVEHARLLAQIGRVDDALGEYALAVGRRAGDRELRDEYAAALLQARRYAEAADQYRRLLAADRASISARLGLARALSWGEQPRAAEPVLRDLVRALPGDTTVLAMLHSVRAAIDPTAEEAAAWVSEEPRFAPYRLAYARALVEARRPAAAVAQFDTLLMAGESVALLREAAGVHAAIPDSVGSARLLGRAVALAPGDSALRRDYAKALSWSGDTRGAIEQLTLLLREHPNADDLLMRGRLYLWSGDQNRAEPDLIASARMSPRVETYTLL
ncbi:MAG TPA: tetratricopeptide repeat protein, partial [Gemmatimonadaceae bacterium]|nr:tetratricopeptide repeat protein [Gemmatimonadaceae bacterium]